MLQDPAPEAEVYRFERRRADRWPAQGIAVAHVAAGERFGERVTLKLRDESADGVGAIADRPLPPGCPVSVDFSALGRPICPGVIVRCLPCGDGYRVAIRFEARLAA